MRSFDFSKINAFGLAGVFALVALCLPAHAAEKITYFHFDALGSPVAATDEAGNVIWREEYRPFGARIRQEPPAASNTRWYTGHPHDNDTGLTYMGARYYDPVVGRFMAIDPKGFDENNIHSFNRYAYANNNPYKYIDPDGNFPIETVIDAGLVIYDAGRFLGAGIAYTVGAFTGNEALTATALEGLQETSIDLGASATGFVIPYVPATVTRSLTTVTKGPLKNASGNLDDAARAARTQPHQREITQHANQRLQTRDKRVTNEALETAITRGQRNFDPSTGKTVHNLPASQSPTGRGVTTVTNHRGGVVTVIDKGRKFDP